LVGGPGEALLEGGLGGGMGGGGGMFMLWCTGSGGLLIFNTSSTTK